LVNVGVDLVVVLLLVGGLVVLVGLVRCFVVLVVRLVLPSVLVLVLGAPAAGRPAAARRQGQLGQLRLVDLGNVVLVLGGRGVVQRRELVLSVRHVGRGYLRRRPVRPQCVPDTLGQRDLDGLYPHLGPEVVDCRGAPGCV